MTQSNTLSKELASGAMDARLLELYQDPSVLDYQRERYVRAIKRFEELFGAGEVELYSVPGRSEVCGNHTDHQHGMVLAASINLDTLAVARRSEQPVVRILSEGYEMVTVDINQLAVREEEAGKTSSLVRGMLAGLSERGYSIGGVDAYVQGDVLEGSGLSSSASFEVLIGVLLSGLYQNGEISPVVIAQTAQFAENVYFKKPCGLMDQMACAVGGMVHIDFQDPSTPEVKQLYVDFSKYQHSLCIVDTKGSHGDLTDDYACIPAEMNQVAAYFDTEYLREVEEENFLGKLTELRSLLGDRPVLRAMHFFAEQRNVARAVQSLNDGEFDDFLESIQASGNSSYKYLQNVYTSRDVKNQNVSFALVLSERILGTHGVCRVHGGGFAGTIQAFVEDSFVEEYKGAIEQVLGVGSCYVLKVRKCGGVQAF